MPDTFRPTKKQLKTRDNQQRNETKSRSRAIAIKKLKSGNPVTPSFAEPQQYPGDALDCRHGAIRAMIAA